MKLGEFHTQISNTLKRGTLYDAEIPSYVRRAARWIERNYTMQYMRKFATADVDPASAYPRSISWPNQRVKNFEYIRFVDGEKYKYLTRIPNGEVALPENERGLQFYWLDGIERIMLDTTPAEKLELELRWVEYSTWSSDANFEHYLLNHAEDLLEAQTLFLLSARLRDPRMTALYTKIRDEALKTLIVAEVELEHNDSIDQMQLDLGLYHG